MASIHGETPELPEGHGLAGLEPAGTRGPLPVVSNVSEAARTIVPAALEDDEFDLDRAIARVRHRHAELRVIVDQPAAAALHRMFGVYPRSGRREGQDDGLRLLLGIGPERIDPAAHFRSLLLLPLHLEGVLQPPQGGGVVWVDL